jgi:hypothetical protein
MTNGQADLSIIVENSRVFVLTLMAYGLLCEQDSPYLNCQNLECRKTESY